MTGQDRSRTKLLLLALSLTALSGCSSWRLPAIDPTGERIFLPAPAATRFEVPDCPIPGHPEPAFRAPPPPPPCPELPAAPALGAPTCGAVPAAPPLAPPVSGVPARPAVGRSLHGHGAAAQSYLVLRPGRVIAPVGSEVVLLSSLCSPDGRTLPRQPVEWTLSQESVGHLVDVASDGHWEAFLHHQRDAGKRSSNFAVSHTVSKPQVITRGTPTPTDDIAVSVGQSWASLTSPTEGTSHVTVLAPNAEGWDRRRQTAVIHWVDAQWVLPPPAIVQSGQQHVLTTIVTRASGAPLASWLVRYEIVGGPSATFAPQGQLVVEVETDAAGRASVPLVPQTAAPGVTQVRIQIIRPAQAVGDEPRLTVGEGWTSVTWSAPGLEVQATGPATAGVDETVTYRVQVTNPGDMVARQVVVRDVLPPGLRFLNSNPTAQILGSRAQWQLGDLPPHSTRTIEVNCRTERSGDVRYCFQAEAAGGLQAEGCAATRITRPALSVQMTGPESVEVGQPATFEIQVTNTFDRPLSGVTLLDRFDPGLEHSEGQSSPIEFMLGDLAVGETMTKALTFIPRQPGQLCHTLEVNATGGHMAVARACVNATPRAVQPALQVEKTGPAQRRVGELAEYVITVRNTGDAVLTVVRVTDTPDEALVPREASDTFQYVDGSLVWTLDRLPPGGERQFRVRCECVRPAMARNQVSVGTSENVTAADEMTTEIQPAPVAPPTAPSPGAETTPPAAGADGQLEVSIADTANPVRVGENTSYLIVIKNAREQADKDVVLTVTLPDGLQLEKITGPAGIETTRDNNRTLIMRPIRELRPGESLRAFRVEVSALRSGRHTVRAQVRSLLSPEGVEVEKETTVFVE